MNAIGIVMTDVIARPDMIGEPRVERPNGWYHPRGWLPPHRVTHPEKAEKLYQIFQHDGWDCSKPNLLGYVCDITDDCQLISGSHRHAAALAADILIPIDILSHEYLRSIWGTDEWIAMLKNSSRCEQETI